MQLGIGLLSSVIFLPSQEIQDGMATTLMLTLLNVPFLAFSSKVKHTVSIRKGLKVCTKSAPDPGLSCNVKFKYRFTLLQLQLSRSRPTHNSMYLVTTLELENE